MIHKDAPFSTDPALPPNAENNATTGVRKRVFDAILAIKFTGREPKKIFLTPEDEAELTAAGPEIHGAVLWQQIQEQGLRAALKRYLGMRVFWDSDVTKVE